MTEKYQPTTHDGVVIPYVAEWASERVRTARHDPNVERLALYPANPCDREDDTPNLGVMEASRQRWVVLRNLCQVCARPLGVWRWCADLGRPATVGGKTMLLRSEPPACLRCIALAVRVCPGLNKRKPHFTAAAQVERFGQMLNGKTLPDYVGPRVPVVGFVEFVITNVRDHMSYTQMLDNTHEIAAREWGF